MSRHIYNLVFPILGILIGCCAIFIPSAVWIYSNIYNVHLKTSRLVYIVPIVLGFAFVFYGSDRIIRHFYKLRVRRRRRENRAQRQVHVNSIFENQECPKYEDVVGPDGENEENNNNETDNEQETGPPPEYQD